jgi:hypothetical protein
MTAKIPQLMNWLATYQKATFDSFLDNNFLFDTPTSQSDFFFLTKQRLKKYGRLFLKGTRVLGSVILKQTVLRYWWSNVYLQLNIKHCTKNFPAEKYGLFNID